MKVVKGNPNHPVVQEIQNQWYKLCALVMFKADLLEVQISKEDIEKFTASGLANIVVHPKGETMMLSLVSDAEGECLAREAGGLPI